MTSIGFFEQAVAVPSMKAALEAWGSGPGLFHHGFAKETNDPAIVAATMAKPGVVLKRAVGSKGAFTENPQLPKSMPSQAPKAEPKRAAQGKPAKRGKARPTNVLSLVEARAAKRAAEEYDKQQARREKEDEKKEVVRQKERERRDAKIAKADLALASAEKRHDESIAAIARERDALNRQKESEEVRWQKEKARLRAQRDRL